MDVPRTREEAQDNLEAITDQISEGLEKGRYTLSQLQQAVSAEPKMPPPRPMNWFTIIHGERSASELFSAC